MAKSCDICGKTYNKAKHVNKLRGQYNRAGIKIQKPNLQKRNINGIKMLLCTKCVKTMTKVRNAPKKVKRSEKSKAAKTKVQA